MRTILLILFLGLSLSSYSTPQVLDLIIYKNDTIKLLQHNLMNGRDFNKLDLHKMASRKSTNCWDGVYSIWTIRNNSLFLIETRECSTEKIIKNENKIANWYTGMLYIPMGKIIYNDSYSGYPPSFEEEIEFEINEGKIISEKILDNRNTRTSYSKLSKLDNLILEELNIEQIKKLRKEKSVFKAVFTVKLNKNWAIDSIDYWNYETNSKYNFITKDIILKKLKEIKDWDAIYLHGEPYEVPLTHSIYFDKKTLKKHLLTLPNN